MNTYLYLGIHSASTCRELLESPNNFLVLLGRFVATKRRLILCPEIR